MKGSLKKGLGLGLLLAMGIMVQAQTFDEWFEQKKTQISYLYKQIAVLEAYRLVTEKGYQIVQKGTQMISDSKQGDFDLHSGYFSSLLTVNPSIRQYPKVDDMLTLQAQILAIASQARQIGEAIPAWSATIAAFYAGLLKECEEDLEMLELLTTDGSVQMTDAQRLEAIDRLYERMKKRWADAIRARDDVIILFSNY